MPVQGDPCCGECPPGRCFCVFNERGNCCGHNVVPPLQPLPPFSAAGWALLGIGPPSWAPWICCKGKPQ